MLLASSAGCSEETILVFVVRELVDGCSGLGVQELDLRLEVTDATVSVIGNECRIEIDIVAA